jgi:hypothetical protein
MASANPTVGAPLSVMPNVPKTSAMTGPVRR